MFLRSPEHGAEKGRAILAFATQGSGGHDEARLMTLLEEFPVALIPFSRKERWASFRRIYKELGSGEYALAVMEGSGIAGGLALLCARVRHGQPFVVSSGDAIGPFLAARFPLGSPVFRFYERSLYRFSAGFIGWSPYLVGRALTMGASCGVTAEGWSSFAPVEENLRAAARRRIREQFGIPENAVVAGIAGSLVWNRRVGYCYGLELAAAMRQVERPDVHVLIVGGGSGQEALQTLSRHCSGAARIHLAGPVDRSELPAYLAAMDLASLPQSVDGVGNFRYTTKLSEYLSMRLPVMISRIPAAYDLDQGAFWSLGGSRPWEKEYIGSVARLLNEVTLAEVQSKQRHATAAGSSFNRADQIKRVSRFLRDLLGQPEESPQPSRFETTEEDLHRYVSP